MSKIVYIGIPAHGHTNPTLPVVQELIARGHEVLYYNAEPFRSKVAPTGVDFRAYPEPMPTEREISEALYEFINASLMFTRMSRHLTGYMIDEMRREQPDLILYDTTCMWGYIAGRTLNIPHTALITHFILDAMIGKLGVGGIMRYIASTIPHLGTLMSWKREMKQKFGEVAGGITEYSDHNLVFTSKEFHPAHKFIDDRFHFVGASLNPATRDGTFDFSALDGRRMVYISLGTINHLDMGFYHAAFEAFRDYPAQFVLSAGKNTDLSLLGDVPTNFIVRNYVPQLEILQRADAFITHGGMNSVHESLVYGVPMVVVPHHIEQLLNAKRVHETETGIMLGSKPPYGHVTAAELRRALDTVLNDPRYQQNAVRYGQSLIDAGGYLAAADQIESRVGTPSPVMA